MTMKNFKLKIQGIVKQAASLKNRYTDEVNAPVNYACVFCQSEKEFKELSKLTKEIGKIVKQTYSGPLFYIKPLHTVAGKLKLLKIRKPDLTKPEEGDADFTVKDYQQFKERYLKLPNFKLIKRPEFEMLELMDNDFNVRVYFSHPTLLEILKIS